jgi:hypothetical protein
VLPSSSKRTYPVAPFRGRVFVTPGTVLQVPWDGALDWLPTRHVGLAGDRVIDGYQSVIHLPRTVGSCVEQPLPAFAPRGVFGVLGYPGDLAPEAVVALARTQLGRQYDVLRFNCEHLVSWAHGLGGKSTQLRRGVAGGVALGAAALAGVLLLRR